MSEEDCKRTQRTAIPDAVPGAAGYRRRYLFTLACDWTIFLLKQRHYPSDTFPVSLVDDTIGFCRTETSSPDFLEQDLSYQTLAITTSTLAMHLCLKQSDLERVPRIMEPLSTIVDAQSETTSKEVNQITLAYLEGDYQKMRLEWYAARRYFQDLHGFFMAINLPEDVYLNILEVQMRLRCPQILGPGPGIGRDLVIMDLCQRSLGSCSKPFNDTRPGHITSNLTTASVCWHRNSTSQQMTWSSIGARGGCCPHVRDRTVPERSKKGELICIECGREEVGVRDRL